MYVRIIIPLLILLSAVIRLIFPQKSYSGGVDKPIAFVLGDMKETAAHARSTLECWTVYDSIRKGIRPDFVYADGVGLQDRRVFIPARLRCRLDARALFDKIQLHLLLMQAAPHTIAHTLLLDTDVRLPADSVWVVRSNWGGAGSTTRFVQTQSEFEAAYRELSSQRNPYRPHETAQVIASEYIRDPMLYRGFKFHIRMYVVVSVSDVMKAWVANNGVIVPAALPYIAADFANGKIHDTHMSSNPAMIGRYPADLPAADLPVKINETLADVMRAVAPSVRKYDEVDVGYDLYGVDVMITADGVPKVIEFNRFPLVRDASTLFDIVIASAFSDVFGPTGDQSLITRII